MNCGSVVAPTVAMPRTTAIEAPALSPRIPGSASGLRVIPCITAPARPREAPTSSASTVRGTRPCTAASAIESGSGAVSAGQISPSGISREPYTSERTIATASAAITMTSASALV